MDIIVRTKNSIEITEKDYQILDGLTNGYRSREIAVKMKISNRTVEAYIDKLREKFNANTQAHLVAILMDAVIVGLMKQSKSKK